MIDRSFIGHKSEALTVAVEPFQLRLFAKACLLYTSDAADD